MTTTETQTPVATPATQRTLRARCEYNEKYPPAKASKAYVARITGRADGAVKYAREFLGREVTLLAGDEGLYEVQIAHKKGGYTRMFYVVLSHVEQGLIVSCDCEGVVAQIAKLLDDGHAIQDIVEAANVRPATSGKYIFDATIRTAQAPAPTVDQVVEAICAAARHLSAAAREEAFAAAAKRLAEGGAA